MENLVQMPGFQPTSALRRLVVTPSEDHNQSQTSVTDMHSNPLGLRASVLSRSGAGGHGCVLCPPLFHSVGGPGRGNGPKRL